MAKVDITNDVLELNKFKELTEKAGTAEGARVDFSAAADNKMILVFTGAGTVTITRGDQGVADSETFTVTALAAIRIDSLYFKKSKGEDAGCVLVKCTNGVKVTAIQLP